MAQLLAVVGGGDLSTHAVLALEALRKAADRRNQPIALELRGAPGGNPLPDEAIRNAGAVLLVGSGDLGEGRFGPLHRARAAIADVLTDVNAVLDRALSGSLDTPTATAGTKRIVAITSCPTGIAHTFMAAEGLQAAADALGHSIRIETQGSVGARDTLTAAEIAAADIVLIAADTGVDRARFAGKRLYATNTKAAIRDGKGLIATALSEAQMQAAGGTTEAAAEKPDTAERKAGAYKHLMTGVSFMLPFVVAGGLLIALAFAVGGIDAMAPGHEGTLGYALGQIGAKGPLPSSFRRSRATSPIRSRTGPASRRA